MAAVIGADTVRWGLKPEDKTEMVRRLGALGPTVMVGDGINDAPSLAAADVGISIVRGNADLAIQASDIIVLHGGAGGLPVIIGTGRKLVAVIRQNYAWAIGFNTVGIALATAGLLSPWLAALFHHLSSVLVVANSARLVRTGRAARRAHEKRPPWRRIACAAPWQPVDRTDRAVRRLLNDLSRRCKENGLKTLPAVEHDYRRLYDMVSAPIRARLLLAGLDLGVFDVLGPSCSAEEAAATLGTDPGNTGRLLDALATIGLLEKRFGRYGNGPEAAAFLVKTSPTFIGALLQLVQRQCVDPLEGLVERVRSGPLREARVADFAAEDRWAAVTRVSAAWVTGGVGARMARIIAGLPEFAGLRRMLDLGGGHGLFSLYFVATHPTLTAVVLDRPAVVTVAEAYVREYRLEDRVSTMAGDYLSDDIGSGYDLVWACSTLNFARHALDPLVAKIFAAMNPGGLFIAFQDGMTGERTRPDTMLGHLADAVGAGRDYAFDQGEIAAAMLRCGFRSVRSRTIDTPMGAMDMDVARK